MLQVQAGIAQQAAQAPLASVQATAQAPVLPVPVQATSAQQGQAPAPTLAAALPTRLVPDRIPAAILPLAPLAAAAAAPTLATAAQPTRLVPDQTSASILPLAPSVAAGGNAAGAPGPAKETALVPGIVQAPVQAAPASPAWGQPVPVLTPSPAVAFTLALTGPSADVLMPSERAAIQAAIAQAIPSVSEFPLQPE